MILKIIGICAAFLVGIIILAADLSLRKDYNDMIKVQANIDKSIAQLSALVGEKTAFELATGLAQLEYIEIDEDDISSNKNITKE